MQRTCTLTLGVYQHWHSVTYIIITLYWVTKQLYYDPPSPVVIMLYKHANTCVHEHLRYMYVQSMRISKEEVYESVYLSFFTHRESVYMFAPHHMHAQVLFRNSDSNVREILGQCNSYASLVCGWRMLLPWNIASKY